MTRNIADCRGISDRCCKVVTFEDSELIRDRVSDWVDVRKTEAGLPWEYTGVCPACIAASKPREKRVISGGTVFDPAELEAGGRVVVDRQKSLFGDE